MSRAHYAELRFSGLKAKQLQEALLRCQIELLSMGIIKNVEVVIEKEDNNGDFWPIDASAYTLRL